MTTPTNEPMTVEQILKKLDWRYNFSGSAVEDGMASVEDRNAWAAKCLAEATTQINALIAKAEADTAKAYGGCTKCYGKGYATWRHGETYRGATRNMRNNTEAGDAS